MALTFSLEDARSRRWFLPRYHGGPIHEPSVSTRLLETLRDASIFADVGSHLGWFTCLAARALPHGQVYSFEIDPELVTLLRRNIALNPGATVEVVEQAVTDRPGRLPVHRAGNAPGAHATILSTAVADEGWSVGEVEATSLDHFFEGRRPPDVLKIDVEGAELRLLHGMTRLLADHRPTLFIEVHPAPLESVGQRAADLLAMLDAAGYELFSLAEHRRQRGAERQPIAADATLLVNTMIEARPR